MKRPLNEAEILMVRSVLGDAIDYAPVTLVRDKWAFFQPRQVVMAPRRRRHIHIYPAGVLWRDDFAGASVDARGLFVHEMVHVWQHQQGVRVPLARHPWCRTTTR